MRLIRAVTFIAAGLMASPAAADHERFTVGAMTNVDASADSITSVSGTCVPTHDRERLDCYFASFHVSRSRSDDELRKEREEFTRSLDSSPAKHVAELRASLCNDQTMLKPDAVRLKHSVTARVYFTALKTFCHGPSRESALKLVMTMADLDAKKCRCAVSDSRATFIRQIDRWVSNSGPDGLCGVIRVSTLTPHDPKKMKEAVGPTLWRLDERTVVTRADTETCKLFQVKDGSIGLSWDAPPKSIIGCTDFEFVSALEGMSDPRARKK